MQYLTTLVTTDTFAKEVKLFGLGEYFIRRFQLLANTYYDRQRRLVTTRYLLGSLWGLLTTLAGSITYLYVALQAVAGKLRIARFGQGPGAAMLSEPNSRPSATSFRTNAPTTSCARS